jgi:hypothetical protein
MTTGLLTVATTMKATVLSSPSGRYFSLHTKTSPQRQLHVSPQIHNHTSSEVPLLRGDRQVIASQICASTNLLLLTARN